jgi:hypothetical protein
MAANPRTAKTRCMYPPRQPKLPADEQTRIIAKESLSLEAD